MSQNKPLVSVVLAVYNTEKYIKQAVDSILQQSFSDFELIIIDDASTDNTAAILAEYSDPRIVLLRNKDNLGPYGAANKGISIVRGGIIARHDADDVSLPDRFSLQVDALQANPNLVLVGSSYYIIDRDEQIIDITMLPDSNEQLQKRLEYGNIFIQGATMFRKDAFQQVGGYREYFPVTQDYDLFLRLAEVGEIANLPKPLYKFRFHGESISRQKKELQLACRRLAWDLAIQRRSGQAEGQIPEDVVKVYPPEPHRLFQEARGTSYLYYAAGQFEKADASIVRAMTYLPNLGNFDPTWKEWIISHAQSLSNLRNNPREGAGFINWVGCRLSDHNAYSDSKKLLAEYYSAQAFQAYEAHHSKNVLALAVRALKADIRQIRNRGLVSIAIKSILNP